MSVCLLLGDHRGRDFLSDAEVLKLLGELGSTVRTNGSKGGF